MEPSVGDTKISQFSWTRFWYAMRLPSGDTARLVMGLEDRSTTVVDCMARLGATVIGSTEAASMVQLSLPWVMNARTVPEAEYTGPVPAKP